MADGNVVIDVGLNTGNVDKELAKLRNKIEKAEKELESNVGTRDEIAEKLKQATQEAEQTRGAIADITEAIREMEAAYRGDEGAIDFGFEDFTQLPESIAAAKKDLAEQEELLKSQQKAIESITKEHEKACDKIEQERKNLEGLKSTAGDLVKNLREENPGSALAASIGQAQTNLLSFVKKALGIGSIIVLIKKLSSAIVDSVRAFAQEDAQTQATINELRAALAALKASWGAAFAPILTAVAPLLQRLIGWLTTAANAVASFMAVLSGKGTYKKAVANVGELSSGVGGVASGLEDTTEAAKEAEKQLAGFDELNILRNPDTDKDKGKNGGGGAGGAGGNNGFDVVEEDVLPWTKKLAEHLELIKDLAVAIGAAILAWKVGKFLNQLLGLNLTMKQLLGLALAVGGAALYIQGWVDAFNNGVDWDNTISMIAGCAAAAAGLGLAFGASAGAVGLLIGGIGMLLVGCADWIRQGKLSTQTFWLLEAAIAAVGIALAILISPWALIVAAVAAAALAIYKHWDTVKEKWAQLLNWLQRKWDTLKEWWSGVIGRAGDAGRAFIEKLMDGMSHIGEKMQAWWNEKVKPWFTAEKWRELGRTAIEGIKNGLNSIQMPKFHFSWSKAAYNYNFFGKTGTVNIPYPNIDWYAKGGVFDGASIIGVGENGKEAVVPLEHNTEWINVVADGIVERLTRGNFADRLADAFMSARMPAMAGGTVVPPNSAYAGSQGGWNNSIMEELKALRTEISALANQPIEVSSKMYIDRREVGQAVTEYQRSEARVKG